ncbi:hypothetical protein M2254_002270 [Chryseobacterium sp. BIGb0186]|uniref:Uncharacterized protein n=1 Tax=Chryseobacterium indoltheticum TaxID=254 RepID=A0A381FDV4_9FLAO|nr:hypothetical protein [Chryseobacterium sp. JUb44]MDH6210686.1 hypothetical protein [Chryseobacterium sp. BIGb0186]SIQ21367.1 hypothetical protein SAMN05421682_103188 [Chryseobacterium indoltheticum]SUX44648.1 Uncharacterised protein [Chryseobacterium indoltheticum]
MIGGLLRDLLKYLKQGLIKLLKNNLKTCKRVRKPK